MTTDIFNKSCDDDIHKDDSCCVTASAVLLERDVLSATMKRFTPEEKRRKELNVPKLTMWGKLPLENIPDFLPYFYCSIGAMIVLMALVKRVMMAHKISKKGKQKHENKELSNQMRECNRRNNSITNKKYNYISKHKSTVNTNAAEICRIQRKMDFLSRYNIRNIGFDDVYGYSKSNKGYIDTWRQVEFPNLIPPIHIISNERKDKGDHDESRQVTATMDRANHKDEQETKCSTATFDIDFCKDEEGTGEESCEPEVYLDYAGSSLPSKTQLRSIYSEANMATIFANPHSSGPAASRTKVRVERMKKLVLDYFHGHANYDDKSGASPSASWNEYKHPGYDVIFTSGATESLQIVSERFPWAASSKLLYAHNSHTSVIGMRNTVMSKGGMFHCVDLKKLNAATKEDFVNWTNLSSSERADATADKIQSNQYHNHLLVLPAECNFGGDRPNIRHIIDVARVASSCPKENENNHKWYIMLDLAKAAATGPINLQQLDPDFACISFYKMFGEPTGLGALFVKKTSVPMLTRTNASPSLTASQRNRNRRFYFGGGSVDAVLPRADFTYPRDWTSNSDNNIKNNGKNKNTSSDYDHEDIISGSLDSLVHGTIHFRGIVSLLYGFREIDSLGGIEKISLHSKCIAAELVRRMRQLRHDNGNCAIDIYGAWASYDINKNHSIGAADTQQNNNIEHGDGRGKPGIKSRLQSVPGPTVAFNIYRHDGTPVGYNEVSKLAALNRPPIQLRTGCFCNPGACQEALRLSDEDIASNFFTSGHVCGDHKDVIGGTSTGAIRVSFGKDSIWEDMDNLVVFIEKMFVQNYRQSRAHDGVQYEEKSSRECKLNQEMKIKTKHRKEAPSSSHKSNTVLSEMYIFPIKSCAAMRVNKWKINQHTGKLAFDREFALVDATGTAMRLNAYPMMTKIRPSINLDQRTLIVIAPNMPTLVLSLDCDDYSGKTPKKSDNESIRVCGNSCGGQIWGSHNASKWFSSFLGVQCWLARYYRKRSAAVTSSTSTTNEDRAFANEAPLLLISQDSINVLNSVLTSQQQRNIKSCHFRPNLVVGNINSSNITTTTNKKHEAKQARTNPEDHWSEILFQKSELTLTPVGQCARCSMVDIDPSSGKKGKTLRALAGYRRRKGEIMFGTFYSALKKNKTETVCTDELVWIEEGDILLCKQKAIS